MKRYRFFDCSTDKMLGQFSIVNIDPKNYISEILLIFGYDLGKDIYFENVRINEKGIFEDITNYIDLY